MQQFTVPQFIDVEDKIIGPVTTRQFLIILSSAILIALFYRIFDFSLFIMAGVVTLAFCGVFAFAKINGRPFHFFVLNVLQTIKRPHARVWNKMGKYFELKEEEEEKIAAPVAAPTRHYTASRLAELSLIVDTKGVYQGEAKDDESEIMIEK